MRNNNCHEPNYENLIDMFPCALYVIRDSIIIDCNSTAVKMFGYTSKEEILGRKFYEFSPEKQPDGSCSVEKGEEILRNALNSDKETVFKWMLKRKNGDIFVADIIIYNRNGDIYTVMTDIDEIEKLKEELEEKNYLHRMLFENHRTAMLLIDPNTGRIMEANQAAVNYYGYTKDELLNMNIKNINTFSQEQIDQELDKTKSGERNYFEFIHRLANGEEREVEVYTFPVTIDEKVLLFSIINDVSDKHYTELMFNTLFLNSPYAVVILNKEQKIVNISKKFTDLFQYEPDEVKWKYINQLISSEEIKDQIDNNIQLISQGEIIRQEGIRRRKDGKLIYVEIIGYPVIDRRSIIGAYVIYNDISDRKAHEEQLELFKKILENNSEGVVITDISGNIEWINAAFEKITGYLLSEVKGMNMNILKSGIQDQSFYTNMWDQLLSKGTWSGEIWNKTKKGEIYSEWLTISSIKDNFDKTTHYVGIFKDLTEKKRIDRRMAELQQRDTLTGLYNRDYFVKLVDTYIKSCKDDEQFSIIFIDIEGLKEVNSSLGHRIGDKLLVELSKRLQILMNVKYILSRYSGDEFAILCNEKDIKNIAEILLERIQSPFMLENTVLNVLANIGISRFPDDGKDAETLIRYAEIAMYKSKGQLEGKIFFYSREMSEEIEKRFYIANLLTQAITNEELKVYYQPIFNIMNPKNIVGLEALLRWENHVLGNVVPNKFIPLAEKTGYIINIGEWVLRQVCKQIKTWEKEWNYTLPVAVNVSVKQLEQIGFSDKVIEIAQEYDVKPDNVELEITESVSSGDLSTIVKNLKELKKCGFKISMDDFGTGFSSLGQIDRFELDKLKIDKVFIDDLLKISKKQNLVKSIIAMARSLNLTVVAEGIETKEQLVYLKEFGCHLGQGYLLSKPLPVKEIEILLGICKNGK
ncbi:MAG TPA: EAL domain-containing protein [Clostridiaceae bacterium]|nr:EAL domain-containing protein [Clostridiaceae bacterium]